MGLIHVSALLTWIPCKKTHGISDPGLIPHGIFRIGKIRPVEAADSHYFEWDAFRAEFMQISVRNPHVFRTNIRHENGALDCVGHPH